MSWGSGQEINQGRYKIIQRIGTGGFGVTYKAFDHKSATPDTVIAIKTLNEKRQRQANFEQLQENFLNEALSLAKCSHPHVIRVERVFMEGQLWAMVMDYIEGESLDDYIIEQGRLAETQAVEIIQKIGDAVSYVHSQQLLHRDIKPANIMMRSNGEPVLIDFGLARAFVPGIAGSMTSSGTPHYSPPEQAERRRDFTPTLDVYALAATMYTCVTGDLPVMAEIRTMRDSLIAPKELNPQLTDRVNHAIITGMALKQEDRSSTVAEWLKLFQLAPVNYSEPPGFSFGGRAITVGDNDTDDGSVYFERGVKLFRSAEFKDAMKEFNMAIEINPYHAEYFKNRGDLHSCGGMYNNAVVDYGKAISLDPNNAIYWAMRGDAHYHAMNKKQARLDYIKAIEIEPKNATYYHSLGKISSWEDAAKCYSKAIEINSNNSEYWHDRGYLYYELKVYQQAIKDYNKAIEIDSDNAKYWNNRGYAYYYLEQYENAIENYNKAIELQFNIDYYTDPYHNRKGNASYSAKKFDSMLHSELFLDYSKALKLNPENDTYWYDLGREYHKIKLYEKAIINYSKGIELSPDNAVYWNARGNAYCALKQYKKAIEDFTRAVELNPDNAIYLKNRDITYNNLASIECNLQNQFI